tara:strand:+ start:425 stop:607 length:183 start_codon:yes stop_codon:yes gene_type:complete
MNKNIINQIENVRKKNNRNWMNLLRIAFEHAPKETAAVMKKINIADKKISKLVGKLSAKK